VSSASVLVSRYSGGWEIIGVTGKRKILCRKPIKDMLIQEYIKTKEQPQQ